MSFLRPLSARSFSFLVGLVCLLQVARAASVCDTIDPFANPKQDPCNPFRYIPNKAGNIVVADFFTHSAFLLTLCYIHRPIKWFLVLIIGSWTHALGLWLRLGIRSDPHSLGFMIVEEVFVVLSPCAYLAALYILMGRITQHLDGGKYLRPIKAEKIAKIFVWSDAVTFLIQGNASGLLPAKNALAVKIGRYALLAGLILQFISFLFFCYLVVIFFHRVRKEAPQLYRLRGWKPLYMAMVFTCITMLIRSVYRIAEFAQDHPGYLYTHEIFFFTLDCVPMWLTISVYIVYWPGRILTDETKVRPSILDGYGIDNSIALNSLGEEVGRTRLPSDAEDDAREDRR